MKAHPRFLLVFLMFCFLFFQIEGIGFADDPIFIGKIEHDKDAWLDKKITVEGRITFVDRFHFKFRNSSILFESKKEIRGFVNKPDSLEAVGHLRKEGNSYKFEVTSVTSSKTDSELLSRKRSAIDRNSAQQHYELARWALDRAEYYQDDLLKLSGQELSVQAYHLERDQLNSDDADGRISLAKKGADFGIPVANQEELIHEAYRIRMRTALKQQQPDWNTLAEEIARDCPGAEAQLPTSTDFLRLREEYLRKPLAVYLQADQSTRVQLHRVLWGEVKRLAILAQAELDPSRGAEFATELRKTLPEYQADADKMAGDLLMKRGSDVDKLTRRELIVLKEDYLSLNKPEEANRVVSEWLSLRRNRLKNDDLEGLLQLANDYEALSQDPAPLAPALIDAATAYPQSREILGALERLGYQLVDGKWISSAEREVINNTQHQKDLRAGLVTIGMSASEVRKSQGLPTSLTRISTNGELREIWSYGRASGSGGFTIYFRRGHLDPEAKVIDINSLNTK